MPFLDASIHRLVSASKRFRTAVSVVCVTVAALILPVPVKAQSTNSTASQPKPVTNPSLAKAEMLRQPLGFEPNHGQANSGVDFVSRGRGYSLLLSGNESTFVTSGDASNLKERSIHMQLVGANAAVTPRAEKPLPGKSNYLFGNDPSRWVHGVQQFEQVRLADAYPGIDLLYYGNQKQVEHDFIVSPGTDAGQIKMAFSGAASQTIAKSGALELKTPSGATVSFEKPVAYQTVADDSRRTVTADYATLSDNNIGFRLGDYDHSLPLIIDPVVITYSTYFGGNDADSVVDLKVDPAGNIYLLMSTNSTDLPVVSQIAGACVGACGPKNPDTTTTSTSSYSIVRDFYLAKLDPTGQKLLYSTYIGGSGDDVPGALSLSSDGGIYIAGETMSADFPLVNEYSGTLASVTIGGYPFFSTTITRLSTDGSTILYSSLIGGGLINFSEDNGGFYYGTSTGTIAAGPNGIVYLLGYAETASGGGFGNFVDAKNTGYSVGLGDFLAKFDTTKTGYDSLVYATTFGQFPNTDRQSENLWAVALDSKQNVWLLGNEGDSGPIPTPNAVQPMCGDGGQCQNAYIYELNPVGSIIYASFLGGTMSPNDGVPHEQPLSVAIDPSDNIYITGGTNSIDFPTTKNGAMPTNTSGGAGFLTKLSPGGLSMLYSTYTFTPFSLAVTPGGVAGGASFLLGTGFPVKNGFPYKNPGQNDAVFQIYDTTQAGDASLLVSSYLGAGAFTVGQTAAFDAAGNLLFGGYTESTSLPVVNPFQSTCSGGCYAAGNYFPDGFVTRIQLGATTGGTVAMVPTTQTFPSTAVGATSAALTSTLTNNGASAFVFTPSFTDSTDFKETDTCNGMVAAGANCTFSFTFSPQATGSLTSTFTLTGTTTPATTLTVALSGTATGSPVLTISPSTYAFGSVASGANPVTQTLVLKNTGNVADNALTFNFNETDQGGQTPSLTYGAPCTSLAVGATCNIVITFTPHAGVTATGTLTVNGDAGVTPAVATITGTGTAPAAATLSTTSYSFGSVTDGTTTPATTFTLSNTGGSSLTVSSITISGAGAAAFAVVPGSNCTTAFAANAACTFSVTFSPTAATSYAATVNVADQAGTQMLALSGTGVAAAKPTLTPATLAFGSVNVGTTSASQLLTLNNTTTSTIAALQGITTPAQFGYATGGSCSNTLAAGASCTIAVIFKPITAGPASGVFTVGTGGTAATASVTGTGVAVATVTISPSSLDFGTLSLNATSAAQFLTLSNPTTDTVPLSSVVIPPQFANEGHGSCGVNLVPGTSCTLEVVFQPTSAGPAPGTLTFGPASAALTGTGTTVPLVAFTPANVDFGTVGIGEVSPQATITLNNPGPNPVTFRTVGFSSDEIFISDSSTCSFSAGNVLAPGASCTLQYHFQPTSVGSFSGVLFVTGDDSTATVTFTGIGVAGLPATIAPSSLDFGSVTVGSTVTKTITITNPNPGELLITGGTFPVAGEFVLATNCGIYSEPIPRKAIPANGSCTYSVSFSPSVVGPVSVPFRLNLSDNSSYPLPLTGTGVAAPPTATFTPAAYDFGNVYLGFYSSNATFTFTNTGTVPITFPAPSGLTNTNYFHAGDGCSVRPLAAGASCIVLIGFGEFTGTATGSQTGTFTLNTSAGTFTTTMTGTEIAPTATFTPATYDFGNVYLGTYSQNETFTLTNTSPIAITFTAPSGLTNTNYFHAGDGCSIKPLAAGASCIVLIGFGEFTGTATGPQTGTFTLNTSAGAFTATMTGTELAPTPDFTLTTPTAAALTVSRGSFANLLIAVASSSVSNPFTSPVTLRVSGLPAGATETFSSTTVTPGATGASALLTISVAASTSQNELFSSRGRETAFGISVATLMAGLFGFRRRLNPRLLLWLCALGLLGGLVGCGTGVTSMPAGSSTSNVTVTATSGSISHTITIALTVQ